METKMELKDKVTTIVFQAIDKLNAQLSQEERIEKSLDEQLIGPSSKLDSLGVINLIVAVEEGLQESFNEVVTLANEHAFSVVHSPFKNVQSLIDYIHSRLQAGVHG